MELLTHLRKMRTSLGESHMANYKLQLYHNLNHEGEFLFNDLVGKPLSIHFTGEINCIETGKKIKKTFGEGLSYDAWLKSPAASPSVINPELSRIHEGIALRDFEWEQANHNVPHITYLSKTSGIKVGVTKASNKFSRWIDQGAVEGIVLAETPYRQLAGLIEVELKEHLADKTAWQSMLKNEINTTASLLDVKNQMLNLLPEELVMFASEQDEISHIQYPVLQYPVKVKSLKLDTTPDFSDILTGIKGQYLIFKHGVVFNVRAHSGYQIKMTI
ncbi:MAG: DUF2797 domain-containing protein [Flavobacteriales bacterium]|nr:DUF2797 domain-containing protein [Flavobacteriales bacterium]